MEADGTREPVELGGQGAVEQHPAQASLDVGTGGRSGQGAPVEQGYASNGPQQREWPESIPAAGLGSSKSDPQWDTRLAQQHAVLGVSAGRPHSFSLPAVSGPGEQQRWQMGQAPSKSTPTGWQAGGGHLQRGPAPGTLPPVGSAEGSSMPPPRSPFKGSARQQTDQASGDVQGQWGLVNVGGRQLSSPGWRGEAPIGTTQMAHPGGRHPGPRFLGGGNQQGSTPTRQPLAFGVHLVPGDSVPGKLGAGTGAESQAGMPSRGVAPSGGSPVSAWPPPSAATPSQLPSPRLIVRSMDPTQAQALSPSARSSAEGALRRPARHLDFGAQHGGMALAPVSHQSEGSPPRRYFHQATMGPTGSPARPLPAASPIRGPRVTPEKAEATPKKKQCNCKNSRCLKLYCECFASGNYCGAECNCLSCCNNAENESVRQEAVEATLERNPNAFRPKIAPSPEVKAEAEAAGEAAFPTDAVATEAPVAGQHHKGCHCKKSGCLKKYCECFQANVLCSDACKCIDCKNFDGSDERRLLFAGTIDLAQPPPTYLSPSPPPNKKQRLQDRPLNASPQTKAPQGSGGGRGASIGGYLAGRTPQKPLTKSLLAGVVKADAVQELCKLLAIVTQEVANNFEAQHPGLLAAQQQRQDAAFAAAASSAASGRFDDGAAPAHESDAAAVAGPSERGGGEQSSGDGGGGGVFEDEGGASSAIAADDALLLSCDEELPAEKEVAVTLLAGGLYGAAEEGAVGEGAAARLYALQEQTVLEEFASCLKKIISVGQKRLRQYEESLSPPRAAYSGPPPLHYRPPPLPGQAYPQRFPAGQTLSGGRQAGGGLRYVPQYQPQQQPPQQHHQQQQQQLQRSQATTSAGYRPAYQQQQQARPLAAPPGKQVPYRPLQPPPQAWLQAVPTLGQPLPRPHYSMPHQGAPALGQPIGPQRHPMMRPARQQHQQVRPQTLVHQGMPGGVAAPHARAQGPRPTHLMPSAAGRHHLPPRPHLPLASPFVGGPSPREASSRADDSQLAGGSTDR